MRIRDGKKNMRAGSVRRAIFALALASLLAIGSAPPVSAHAFGTFSISVYSGLVVGAHEIRIRWVLDMAETAAMATVELIDSDDNGDVTAKERNAYFDVWVTSVLDGIQLTVDGQPVSKTIGFRELTLPSGERGSPALRVVMDLTAVLPASKAGDIHEARYRDTNYTDYIGWREVAVAAGEDAHLIQSSAPTKGRTNELTIYPADLGMSVPRSEAEFTFSAATPGNPADDLKSEGDPAVADASRSDGNGAGSAFTIWPTGVLAIAAVSALGALLMAANRNEPARPRR
ncbi:MAG TPA: hypothetical protein VES36_03995 [Candidatus Limnocylindrales bacterium]|nr:hypothetical protein [Candidatus Limnocylindrales bacterium]